MGSDQSKRYGRQNDLVTVCLIAIGFLLVSPSSFACTCAPFPADEATAVAIAYGRADVIFLGVATGVKSKWLMPLRVRDTTFKVIASWKGVVSNEAIVVRAAISEMSCGFTFRKHGRYLLFANRDPNNGRLWTNLCELTREESQAPGLIKALDALKQRKEARSEVAEMVGSN